MKLTFYFLLIILRNVFTKSVGTGKLDTDYTVPSNQHYPVSKNKDLAGSLFPEEPHYCRAAVPSCQPLKFTTCFGVKLPYNNTSFAYSPGISNHEELQEKLSKWKGLIHIPKCWAVIQSYLCALYMPKCEGGFVNLPSMEMCEIIQGPCRILKTDNLWPPEFVCNSSLPSNCKNEVRELKFNITGHCKPPLVQAEGESSFYDGIEGCGVQCHDPLFTEEERQEIRSIVIYGSFLAFFFNQFAVLTFAIDLKSLNKYPSQAVFYINFCFLMVSVGYLYQFRPGAGDSTVCHKDGTLRTSEPSFHENLSCVTSFVFAYYFLIAGIVWFVIFAYAWQLSSRAVGKIKERMDKKGPYYHLVAWSLPLVLTITIMALGEVDGDSLIGICFVGVVNKQMRAIFLLIPLLGGLVGIYFFAKGLITLVHLKITSRDVISKHANAKIRENIIRVLIFATSSFLFGAITFMCNIYEFEHHQSWKDSFRRLLICKLGIAGDSEAEHCKLTSGPSVLMVQLKLLALFGTHINMSSWLWSQLTIQTWTRFFYRLVNKEIEEPVVLKKHRLIARAFAKRKLMDNDGRLSISIYNSHKDPVGLNFELNSLASNNLSTTWAKALPKLITRRGALITVPGSNSSYRRNSADSEVSYSVRRVSLESRRHSLDSTVSVQALEVTKTVLKRPRDKHRKKSRNFEREKRHKRKSRSRNGSSSESNNLETEVLTAFNINIQQSGGIPNMNRRSAISGIELDSLKLLAGKLFDVGNDENEEGERSLSNSDDIKSGDEKPDEYNNTEDDGESDSRTDSDEESSSANEREDIMDIIA